MSADSGLRPGLGTDTDGQKFKKACIIRDVASVKLFIEANVHVNDREAVNFALKTAVERGNLDILNILLNAGIHMNKDNDGGTVGEKALAKAVFRKKFDCVTALLEAGVDVSQIDKDGVTMGSKAFMSATDHGHLDCLIPLIEAGVDVNQMDKDVVTMGEKAFLIAANRGHLDCLIPLIEAGVDVNQKDKDRVTMGRKALMSSARQGHVICLNTLIRAGINVNQKDKDGETIGGKAFKSATNCGHFDCLKILIEAGVNVNQEDKTGVTLGRRAFMCATKRGHLDCLKALIEAGVNVNQKDKFGVTLGEKAFMCATKREHLDYLKALIEAGVNVNQKDKYGGSIGEWAFLSAARCGHLDCLKALIGTGVNVNQEYNHRVTLGGCAFISATNRGHLDCLKALIEAGVNVNQKNEDKVPMVGKALVSAANRGHLDCLKSLIEAGVNVNQTNKGEEPVVGKALVSAANCGHLDCLKILIEAGVNVNQKDKYGITMGVRALMGAVKHGHPICLNALIETGIDLNQSDTDGITMGGKAVIGAVNYGHPICLNALIEAGIDLNQSDQNTCMGIMNDETQQIEDQDMDFELMEVTEQESLCTSDLSNEQTSALLHDYCGIVKSSSVSKYLDKCEQTSTCTTEMVDQGTQTCGDNICMKPIMISTSTQTESSGNITEEKVNVSVGIKTLRPDLTFEDIQHSEELCMFYTGLPNAATFYMLFDELNDVEEHTKRSGNVENQGRPRILRLIDEFFLVLMRLRLGLLLQDLAQRFHVSKSTCSNITNYWITYLSVKLSSLTPWINKKTITETMPRKFQKKYPNCRVIIDCTEIYTETPQSLANKSLMYSNYKSHMTYKALLGISPSGVITFSSDLWAGSVSDKQLTLKSGLLDLCEPGDAIMADKGFLISDLTTPREIKLIIPPLKHQRFNRRQVEETRRIANLRIDVERAMERVKNFRILQGVVPITLSHQVSQIWKVCVSLSNLLPPLVHDD